MELPVRARLLAQHSAGRARPARILRRVGVEDCYLVLFDRGGSAQIAGADARKVVADTGLF